MRERLAVVGTWPLEWPEGRAPELRQLAQILPLGKEPLSTGLILV